MPLLGTTAESGWQSDGAFASGRHVGQAPLSMSADAPGSMEPKTAWCSLIAGLIVADDVVAPEEQLFLDRTMRRLGLSEEERTAVYRTVDVAEAERSASQLTLAQRRGLLDDLVTAAMVDGNFHPAEEQYILRVARALGVEMDFFTGLHRI